MNDQLIKHEIPRLYISFNLTYILESCIFFKVDLILGQVITLRSLMGHLWDNVSKTIKMKQTLYLRIF